MVNGYGVLEVSGRLAVAGYYAPAVVKHGQFMTAHRYHWLNGYAQTVFQLLARALIAIVRHLRVLVHLMSDAVTYKLAHYTISVTLAMLLHCMANVAEAVSHNSLLNALVKRLLCYTQELLDLGLDLTHTKSVARVTAKAVNKCAAIHRHNVAIMQWLVIWNAVHHHIVDRGAD